MKKLVDDIAALTTVSTNALVHLQDKLTLCIGHCVYESKLEKESLTEIDIGIGILYIKCSLKKIGGKCKHCYFSQRKSSCFQS